MVVCANGFLKPFFLHLGGMMPCLNVLPMSHNSAWMNRLVSGSTYFEHHFPVGLGLLAVQVQSYQRADYLFFLTVQYLTQRKVADRNKILKTALSKKALTFGRNVS